MRYAIATIRHKWYVLLAGLHLKGIPLWRLLIHDWTKFTPAELPHYNRYFHGDKKNVLEFAAAWNHHENHNPHHWGYWIARTGKYAGQPLPMPRAYAREMVADWMGAGRAYNRSWDMTKWLTDNLPRITLHEESRHHVSVALCELGYENLIELLG